MEFNTPMRYVTAFAIPDAKDFTILAPQPAAFFAISAKVVPNFPDIESTKLVTDRMTQCKTRINLTKISDKTIIEDAKPIKVGFPIPNALKKSFGLTQVRPYDRVGREVLQHGGDIYGR